MQPSILALFWAAVVCVSILVYVILDGFDLGVGVLFGTVREEAVRVEMMNAIAPIWNGNETWLVVIGTSLFAAFPTAYAVFMGAYYIPVLLLLFGLIFRGVAFEFRFRTERMRPFWDWGFFLGSTAMAFVQGTAVGAMIIGIPVSNGQYSGGAFSWFAPFSIMTGIGLVLGYALLGAAWLVLKSTGTLRDWASRRIPWLAAAMLAVMFVAFLSTAHLDPRARGNLHARPLGLLSAAIGIAALIGLVASFRNKRDGFPFAMTVLFFLSAFIALGAMFWPYIIPYRITVGNAAAPDASLSFLFYGALVILPLVTVYTLRVYWIFRGKISEGYS
jgi:cytochrome bd ubiquinol oxidase subunit II